MGDQACLICNKPYACIVGQYYQKECECDEGEYIRKPQDGDVDYNETTQIVSTYKDGQWHEQLILSPKDWLTLKDELGV